MVVERPGPAHRRGLLRRYPPDGGAAHADYTDSRYIVCAGGPGFDKLFAVSIEICAGDGTSASFARIRDRVRGHQRGSLPIPFALPDGSGVISAPAGPAPSTACTW